MKRSYHPPHLNPTLKKLDNRELQRHYREEITHLYRRTVRQRQRLPHYILRCESERHPLISQHTSTILGFNTRKSLLTYLAESHAGESPPLHQRVHLHVIAEVYQQIQDLRSAVGDPLVDLDALVELINSALAGCSYINIIDLKKLCESDCEEAREERAHFRAQMSRRRQGDHPFSRRDRVAYLQEYYPEVLPSLAS